VILLDTNNSGVYAALRVDDNETLLVLVNLTDEAITNYALTFEDADLAGSTYSAETLFGTGQANGGILTVRPSLTVSKGPERSGEAFPEYKPFENLNPYAMVVIKFE